MFNFFVNRNMDKLHEAFQAFQVGDKDKVKALLADIRISEESALEYFILVQSSQNPNFDREMRQDMVHLAVVNALDAVSEGLVELANLN